ncbi:MAG: SPOR domain-containing protein, partial [Gammaproteobacteria bacterium]|nr:SPOR domain-containing protein [Gammaproteobacteria bacterium]
VVTVDGQWGVNLMSLLNRTSANRFIDRLHQAGYAATGEPAEVNGQSWTRIRINGFVSREDAESFTNNIDNQFGIHKPWIYKF